MPTVKKKKNSMAEPKIVSKSPKILEFFGYCYTKFARHQRLQFNSAILHKLFFAMEVSERCLSSVKSYFQPQQISSDFLMLI